MFQPVKKVGVIAAALAAAALGGSALAGAATSPSTTAASGSPPQQSRPAFPAHGGAAHENAEKPVTGSAASKARAAAVKSVGGGTAGTVTTDYSQSGNEVTVTKSDGSKVEVHLDGSFNVSDHGGGPPRGGRGYGA
jgi:hypothetical protein